MLAALLLLPISQRTLGMLSVMHPTRALLRTIRGCAVTAKVQQMHAAGTLSKLTMPEMKAYLKSMKLPVGGKKGELEERVRQSLGGGGGGGTAAGPAAGGGAAP